MYRSISTLNDSLFVSILLWVAKLFVITMLGWIVFDKVIDYQNSGQIFSNFKDSLFNKGRVWSLIVCLTLTFLNWFFESKKWQQLLRPYVLISTLKAAEGVLIGLSTGIVTPSRLGEYGGRVWNLPKGSKIQGMHSNFLSSLSQNIINVFFGICGAVYYINNYLEWSRFIRWSLYGGSLVFLMLLGVLYYGHNTLKTSIVNRLPDKIFARFGSYFEETSSFKNKILIKALILSAMRYLVFTGQYALLLYYFGVTIPFLAMISGIFLVFLIQSGIPLPPFLSMLARVEIAVIIWSVFERDVMIILSATFSLWIINLLIPSLIGAIFLVKKPILT